MTKAITLDWLKSQYACEDQLKIFVETFGESAELNEVNAAKAIESNLDLDWLAVHILTTSALADYERVTATAWAEYERVTATEWAKYERATAPAWAEYERVTSPAGAEYEPARPTSLRTTAWAEYHRATATAWAEYERFKAAAIIRLAK
jgi:hypothetical protein